MKNHHTQKIQEIIKGKPLWLTRWGMTLLFSFFCVLFILTALVPYQEVAKVDSQISGINKIQPDSLKSHSEFIISCKIQSNDETLKIKVNQIVTIRPTTTKLKVLKITGKIKKLYKYDNETKTLMISVITPNASKMALLLSTPINSAHLDIFTGETVLFKQLLESITSNFRTAKF